MAGTSDFREVLSAVDSENSDALLALRVWSWRVRHYIGAYAALMGGPDALVSTGGIGENSVEARLLCVEGLGFMGIEIDEYLNGRGASAARTISPAGGGVAVMVIPTNEELGGAR